MQADTCCYVQLDLGQFPSDMRIPGLEMGDFTLEFDLSPLEQLDKLALLACQEYNLGNRGDWFGCFRSGLHGFYARIYSVQIHFFEVHTWIARVRPPTETEHHVSTILFGMDSALECFVFALNGLGFALKPSEFLDISDAKALRQISPWNILGGKVRPSLTGYSSAFPTLQQYWFGNQKMIQTISEQHDVSKHRAAVFSGGQARLDPPSGFYESLGLTEDQIVERALFWPMAEILLMHEPKSPLNSRQPVPAQDCPLLEAIAEHFCTFVNSSCTKAFDDAKRNISLPHADFLKNRA